MTEQEAMEQLKTMYPKTCKMIDGRYTGGYDDHTSKGGVALDIAIKALEKQMPKKPIIKTNLMTKHVSAHCSICDTDITYYSSGENYCHNCGQALKWE